MILKNLSPVYEKQYGHNIFDDDINYEDLYNKVLPDLRSGKIWKATKELDDYFKEILGDKQAWFSGNELLPSKMEVLAENLAAGFVEESIDFGLFLPSLLYGAGAMVTGENFWEYQSKLTNVAHDIANNIADENSVAYGHDFDDDFVNNGRTWGIGAAIAAEYMIPAKFGMMRSARGAKIYNTAAALMNGFIEGNMDAIDIRDGIIQKGELLKQQMIGDKTNEFYQNFDPNRPYDATVAQQNFNRLYQAQGADLFNKLKEQYSGVEHIGYLPTDEQLDQEVQQMLRDQAIAMAQAEDWFSESNTNFDDYIREEANAAYGRVLVEEGLTVNTGTLLGLGIQARLMPAKFVNFNGTKWQQAFGNWLRGVEGKMIGNTTGRAAVNTLNFAGKAGKLTIGEFLEESGQSIFSSINTARAENNIEEYARNLYYGIGSDFASANELGFAQGLTKFSERAWEELDPDDLFTQVAVGTLLMGRPHLPGNGKTAQQIRIENNTLRGKVFDNVRKYTVVQTQIGDILAESKAATSDLINMAQAGFESFYNNSDVTDVRQTQAAAASIGAQMIAALETGKMDAYQTKAAAFQVAEAVMLSNAKAKSPKFANNYLEVLQNRANYRQLKPEQQAEVLQAWLKEFSTNEAQQLNIEDQIEAMVSVSQRTLDLVEEADKVFKKYQNNGMSENIEVRPLVFAELLNNLAPKVISDNWQQLSSSIDKVLNDNASNEKFKSPAYQYIIDNYFKEGDFNKRLNALIDINEGTVKDISKDDLNNAFNDIVNKLSMEVPNVNDVIKSDINLARWRSDIYKEWNNAFDKALKGEGLIPEEELDRAYKNLTTDKYKKKVGKEIRKRRKNVNDLVRYLDSLNNEVDAKKHENDKNELFKELEEKDPESYKNLTTALEILQTADNIKDVLKEVSLNNKEIQKIYNNLEQAVDLAKLNVEKASDLLNIGTYSNIINDSSGITQGYLTDILSDINQQSEVPTVETPKEGTGRKYNAEQTKNRVKQHRKERVESRKTEEIIAKEKEFVNNKYADFSNNIKDFVKEFNDTKNPSSDKLQDWLQYVQQLISDINSREYTTYVPKASLDTDLEVLQALEDNIINELAKAIHEEQMSTETKSKIDSEITKHSEKPQPKKVSDKVVKQANKVKKLNLADFKNMQERIASIFNELNSQNADYDRIVGYIWNDTEISKIVKEVFGTKENMSIFYETIKDFNNYHINSIENARYIVNQVALANLLNVDPNLLQTPDILDKLVSIKLKEIFGHGNVRNQHKEAINEVIDNSSEYYNKTIAARYQLYGKLKEASDNNQQVVLQEAPDDCKITVKVNGKKVPLIISKAQATREDNKTKQVDNSLLFKDEQSSKELPIETGNRIDWSNLFNESVGFLSGATSITQVRDAIYEDAFQYIYNSVQNEVEQNIGQTIILDENRPEISKEDEILESLLKDYLELEQITEHPIVIELNGKFLPYYTKNNNYKSGEVITVQTEDGVKAATILYYGLPEDNSEYNIKATSLDNIVVKSKPIPTVQNKGINATVIRPAIREDNKSVSKEAYKEVQDRIDYGWANDGNVHVGDSIGFVVYTWNSPEGPRRVIYYTTEKQEDGSYHILEVLDQGSYTKQINPNSPIGKLINRIRKADTGVDGFYYQEEGWQVNKVTYNHANPTNKKLSFEEGNLNKILDDDNGVFGVKTDGKVDRVILIKQDRTGFVSTDKNFTQDTLLNSNPNSERERSTRVASNREGASMRENLPFIVVPTTDGYEALLLVNFAGPSVEGYMDIIKRSLLNGKVGEMLKADILQRITDLFRNTRTKGSVEKPASVSLAKFFKTNNQALVISNDNANTFSIYLTSPDGTGGTTSTLLATVNYPADINNASKEDKTTKDLITSSQLEVLNGATGTISTTNFDDVYKAIVNRITSETNPVINSVNINFEQIQDNPVILDSLIADGLLWSAYAPLDSNGKIKRTGAQVEATNTKESKKIALVNFKYNGPVLGYNIDGLDVQVGDNVESKFGGNQGRVIDVMTATEYDQYRKDNNLTDKWTSEEVLKQPQAKFIDRHTKVIAPAPVITASTTEYTSNISNEESVKGNIPKPVETVRKKKAGTTKQIKSAPQQVKEATQSDAVDMLPSSEVIQENIFKSYEQITDEGLLTRLDEVGVTEEQWNRSDPFARERLITCGKW